MVLSNIDTPTAATAANNKAARKTFMALPNVKVYRPAELFGRHGPRSASRRRTVLGLHFLDPERVMLFGPVEIHLTRSHRIERALHPDGADVDVSQHGGDEEHGDHGMDHGPELQHRDVGRKVWEQQEPAGHRHQRSADDHDPENAFLAGVEAPGWRMLAFGQDATALLEPLQIDLAGNVILDPDQEHDDEAEHERERQIVMGVFGVGRHGRESFRTEQRQNQDTTEADVQA